MPRDPLQFPRFENDLTFTWSKEATKSPQYKPIHLAQNDEPWCRLYNTTTLASFRRSVFYEDAAAPKDLLDLHLKTTYGLFPSKTQVVIQKDEEAEDEGVLDKSGYQSTKQPPDPETDSGFRVWIDAKRASVHSFKGKIECPHSAATNRGYSRKHDGGFYCL